MTDVLSRRRMLALTAGAMGSFAGCVTSSSTNGSTPTTGTDTDADPNDDQLDVFHVTPEGNDTNRGTEDAPLASIQEAVDRTQPGGTVRLAPGEYRETVRTVRDGTPEKPITITGPAAAVIRPPPGPDVGSVVKIEHHHTHLRGVTIDGLARPARKFETYDAWARNCVFLSPVDRARNGEEIPYLRGSVVEPARLGNANKPLVQTQRIRDTTIGGFEVIGPAGMRYDPRVDDHEIGHVREILYVGSVEPRRTESYWPYDTLDRSRDVRIHHIDNSAGYAHNEFVEVKLGSTDVTIEYCTDRNAGHNTESQTEAAIILNGKDCTVRWNDIGQCPIPVSVSPWAPSDDVDSRDWGRNHEIYGNHLHDFAAGVFQFRNAPADGRDVSFSDDQRIVCGNRIESGSLNIEPWIPPANGFSGTVADRTGQEEVTVVVGAGPDGRSFDPPVVAVDPGTTVTWEWAGSGDHSVVRRNRIHDDPETVPDPRPAPNAKSVRFDDIGLERQVCYNHHDEGMRAAVLVTDTSDSASFATEECATSLPSGDGVGHNGGDSPEA